ncbi:MAG: hypothetical protein JW839_19825 [Candidatus Lokiarchaeota archaeon]|nr:hypothetical protein [Candidatus Lokiarchaeota archaeon]
MENANAHHYFLKAWYDGQSYSGSQYQPARRTVDGAIVEALRELGYLPTGPPHNEYFKVAGRTDRGVSALAAVYYARVLKPLHPCEVNERLRANGHPIMIWSVARLDAPANPRQALARTYKYFHVLARKPAGIEGLRDGLTRLAGAHDFKGFAKAGIDPLVTTKRTLDAATADLEGDVIVFTFQSRGFLWEQVRRMVAFLLDHASEPDFLDRIDAVLQTGEQPNMAPAPPAGLVLWDVRYGPGIRWEDVDGCREQFVNTVQARYIDARTRSAVLQAAYSTMLDTPADGKDGG